MTKTIPFDKLKDKGNDLFELVIVTARRARQINALRLAKYPMPSVNDYQEETFEETPPEEIDEPDWDNVERPTTQAIQEMLAGKINYRYARKEEEKPEGLNLDIPE
jgi:DNA-directed RNA polymerase omega subunit